MTESHLHLATVSNWFPLFKRKKASAGLGFLLVLMLLTPDEAALAQCTISGSSSTCVGNITAPSYIGGGSTAAGDNQNITVGDGTTQGTLNATGGGTVISVHDDSMVTIKTGATVQGTTNSNGGGNYNSGPNLIEANSNNVITVQEGATVTQLGNTTNGEAINVHGYNNVITNNGTIHSHNGAALWFQDNETTNNDAERNKVVNNVTGVISTDKGAGYNVFGSSRGSSGPGLDFENYGTIEGSLRFGNGNDSLLFGATSKISGNVDGGGGTNDLTLNAGAGESATLGGAVANFSTITKTGAGGWAILGGVPSTPGDPNPSSPITGSLNNITSLTVDEGYLSLIGANPDFTGTTTINAAGTLSVQAQGINNSTQVTNNGTLIFDQSFDDTYSGAAITGTGQLNKQGSGDLVMSSQGANTYSGGTHVYEGAIVVDQDSDLGASTGSLTLGSSISSGNTNGTLKFDSSFDLSTTRDITLADGGGTIDTQSYNTTITQDISGTGSLTKDGSGVLELHGSKTYTGNTFVQAGTLAIDAENSLGTGTQLILQDTSTLRLDANNIDITRGVTLGGAPGSHMAIDTQGYTGTVSGTIGGQGALVKNGTGLLQLYANNSYGGGTIINEGTVAINADSGLATPVVP